MRTFDFMSTYDYIIIGAGASGLLLADAMVSDSFFKEKSILILEKSNKSTNDRTWCFWEEGKGRFDDITYRTWPKIQFRAANLISEPKIAPYSYKMVRGIDFYAHYQSKLQNHANLTYRNEAVQQIVEKNTVVQVSGSENDYKGLHVFDSRFDYQQLMESSKYPVLQQHFLGWFVKTEKAVFNPEAATFMDFSIPQRGNTRFMYVLPFSETEALVEYTLFSRDVLEKAEYEGAISSYLDSYLKAGKYTITEVEKGNIPMTCFDFGARNTDRVIKIGIAGGWAKPSTGYTFYRSFKMANKLAQHLKQGKRLSRFSKKDRFWFYDLLLLDILNKHNHLGALIFEALFKKRRPQLIFKFLDEGTSLVEDIYIMAAPKPWPFIKALLNRLFKLHGP